MIKYIIKHIRRGIISNILFCLLLGLAGALLCISAGLWFSSFYALRDLDDAITTIAMPDFFQIERFAEETGLSRDEIIQPIRDEIYTSGYIKQDNRQIFNAIAEDISPIPLRATTMGMDSSMIAYTAQSFAMFVVSVEKLDSTQHIVHYWDEEIEEFVVYAWKVQNATFYVDEVLHLHESYVAPRYINVEFGLNPDGSTPFELREKYVVMGSFTGGGGLAGGSRSILIDDLFKAPSSLVSTNQITTDVEIFDLFSSWSQWAVEYLPFDLMQTVYDQNIDTNSGEYGFFKLTGDADAHEELASPQRAHMMEALENIEISSRSFQVMTTNDPLSLLRLNQRRNLFEEGRTFTAGELRNGERVCLVSRAFAEHNELELGDTIPLQLYASVFGSFTDSYLTSETLTETTTFWVPSLYSRDLEITEPVEYTVVGIMNIVASDPSPHAIPRNLIIIPDNSFDGVEGEPVSRLPISDFVPLLNEGIVVPNGRIDETKAVIDRIVPGYGSLFRFYDQGYGSVSRGLNNLFFGLSWILGLAVAVWVSIAYLYSFFFTARKRKEAAVLNSIGASKAARFFWVFMQGMIPIILSLGISLALTLPLYEYIIEAAVEITQEFTESFRDLTLSDAADSGIRRNIPLEASENALILSGVTGAIILLVITGFMSAKTAVFKTLSSVKEDN